MNFKQLAQVQVSIHLKSTQLPLMDMKFNLSLSYPLKCSIGRWLSFTNLVNFCNYGVESYLSRVGGTLTVEELKKYRLMVLGIVILFSPLPFGFPPLWMESFSE